MMKKGGKSAALDLPKGESPKGSTVRTPPPDELLIIVVDVGQGECTLIIEREAGGATNRWVGLVDGGLGLGRGTLQRYLEAFGIKTIDMVLCTHFDADHTVGLIEFFKLVADKGRYKIKQIFVRDTDPKVNKSQTKPTFIEKAGLTGATLVQAKVHGRFEQKLYGLDAGCKLQIRCLHTKTGGHTQEEENLGSIALLLKFGNFTYYTAGDLPFPDEVRLLGDIGRIDAFKCGHHGAEGSTPNRLLKSAEPRLAFISCGKHSYGHPSYGVIERLTRKSRTVEAIYLTNCFHNRRGVNPKYLTQETTLAKKIQAEIDKRTDELDFASILRAGPAPKKKAAAAVGSGDEGESKSVESHDGAASESDSDEEEVEQSTLLYDEEAILANLEKLNDISDAADQRLVRAYLRAAKRAAAHQRKKGLRKETIGVVAGSAKDLGTLLLRVPYRSSSSSSSEAPPQVPLDVGFVDGERNWCWCRHAEGAKTAEKMAVAELKPDAPWESEAKDSSDKHSWGDLASRMANAVVRESEEEQGELVVVHPPGSPGRFERDYEAREEKWSLFDLPTVTGLRRKEDGSQSIDFCAICRIELIYGDTQTPLQLYELACSTKHDEAVFVHQICFSLLPQEKLQRKEKEEKEEKEEKDEEAAAAGGDMELIEPNDENKYKVSAKKTCPACVEKLSKVGRLVPCSKCGTGRVAAGGGIETVFQYSDGEDLLFYQYLHASCAPAEGLDKPECDTCKKDGSVPGNGLLKYCACACGKLGDYHAGCRLKTTCPDCGQRPTENLDRRCDTCGKGEVSVIKCPKCDRIYAFHDGPCEAAGCPHCKRIAKARKAKSSGPAEESGDEAKVSIDESSSAPKPDDDDLQEALFEGDDERFDGAGFPGDLGADQAALTGDEEMPQPKKQGVKHKRSKSPQREQRKREKREKREKRKKDEGAKRRKKQPEQEAE